MKATKGNTKHNAKGQRVKGAPLAERRRKIDSEIVRSAAKLAIDLHKDALKELERH